MKSTLQLSTILIIVLLIAPLAAGLRALGVLRWPGPGPAALSPSGHAPDRGDLLRSRPLGLEPVADLPRALPQKDVERALELLEPYWEYRRASDVLHALRLWGPAAEFPARPPCPIPQGVGPVSGREMLDFFLDELVYRRHYPNAPSYFFPSPFGLGVHWGSDPSVTAHLDDFAALAAEVGLPPETPLRWGKEVSNVRAVLLHSFKWFHPAQELEFTAVAYAHYLRPGVKWTDRFGAEHGLDEMVDLLAARDLSRCSCGGTHVPYALAVLLAAHAKERCLSETACGRAEDALRTFARHLSESQAAAGFWTPRWCQALATAPALDPEEAVEWVRITGHHLEWMALVRSDLRPPETSVRRAIAFVLSALRGRSARGLSQATDFNVCSHAARCLVLFSGKRFAADLMTENWRKRRVGPPAPAGRGGSSST